MELSHNTNKATARETVALLLDKHITVATAESCTGGMLSAAITSVSGASEIFSHGIAAYSATAKNELLNVPASTLEEHGTVSEQTAIAMADGIRRKSGAQIGIAVTGVAGPSPSEGHPVGTVYIALANETRVWVHKTDPAEMPTTRDEIRVRVVEIALGLIYQYAQAYPSMVAGSSPLQADVPAEIIIPEAPTAGNHRRFLATILPWRGDTLKERLVKCGVLTLCVAALIVSVLGIQKLVYVSENKSLYSDLQNIYTNDHADITSSSDILPRFRSLYLQNADIGGWIRIEGSGISYPIMKNAGSDYYKDHNFRQQKSAYGVPFFHSSNHVFTPMHSSKVLLVYGNNTRDGQMFSDLLSYRNIDFFRQNRMIDCSTLYTANRWVVFGVMVIDPKEINNFDFEKNTFANAKEFEEYIADIRNRSLIHTDTTVQADDNLLLLVTQADEEYGFENATLVVAARCLRDGEAEPSADTADVRRNYTVLMPRKWVYMHRNDATARPTEAPTQVTTTRAQNKATTITKTTLPTKQTTLSPQTTNADTVTSAPPTQTTVTTQTETTIEMEETPSTTVPSTTTTQDNERMVIEE